MVTADVDARKATRLIGVDRVRVCATLSSQVIERMHKIFYIHSFQPKICRVDSVRPSDLHPRYATVYTGNLRNIIINLGEINNYGVYAVAAFRPPRRFYLFAR